MSTSEVGEATKIRSIYIEAIEAEDYSSLPPVVYVLAYVKTLCSFYGVDGELTESLTADIRQRLESAFCIRSRRPVDAMSVTPSKIGWGVDQYSLRSTSRGKSDPQT